jgi:hypothetical protein
MTRRFCTGRKKYLLKNKRKTERRLSRQGIKNGMPGRLAAYRGGGRPPSLFSVCSIETLYKVDLEKLQFFEVNLRKKQFP